MVGCRSVLCSLRIPDHRNLDQWRERSTILPEFLYSARAAHLSAILWSAVSSCVANAVLASAVASRAHRLPLLLPEHRNECESHPLGSRAGCLSRPFLVSCRRGAVLLAVAAGHMAHSG